MSSSAEPKVEELLAAIAAGDRSMTSRLLDMHRGQLRRMISARIDTRLAPRVDPSDVIQETFVEAMRELDDYLSRRPLPFYPWLRQLAWKRLVTLHRHHVQAQRRSVQNEMDPNPRLSAESEWRLAQQLVASETSPSGQLMREELWQRVKSALGRISSRDREVLVLRYLEHVSTRDAAAILGISQNAFAQRHVRALMRIRKVLDQDQPDSSED